MNEQKTDVILKKDLPTLKAGAVFKWYFSGLVYMAKKGDRFIYAFTEEEIKSNPDWFEIVEPKEFTESQFRQAYVMRNMDELNLFITEIRNKK